MEQQSEPYKVVKVGAKWWHVVGPDGKVYDQTTEVENAIHHAWRRNRDYFKAIDQPYDVPEPSRPSSSSSSSSPTPPEAPVSPLAFEVAHFGDKSGGYGVFGPTGAIEKSFATRKEADAYATQRRSYFEGLARGTESPASSAPPSPTVPSSPSPPLPTPPSYPAGWKKGVESWADLGASPAPGASSFPVPSPPPSPVSSPYPAKPGEPGFVGPLPQNFGVPAPWIPAPGERGFIGPMPQPVQPQGPTSWIPSPGQPGFVGPLPRSFYPQAPTPWIPAPGERGFIGPMPQPAASPVPTAPAPGKYGFIGPLPQSSKDLMDSLRKALDAATNGMPHANGGRFDWQKIGHGIAQGINYVGASSPTSGVSPSVISAALMAATVSKAVSRELGFVGGMITVSAGLGRFAENVNDANRRLAPFNGRIATAFAQLDFGDFRRDFRMGAATAETATRLTQSINATRDAWVPVEVLQANVKNRLGTFAAEYSRVNGNVLALPAHYLNKAMDYVDPGATTSAIAGQLAAIGQWGLWGAGIGRMFGPLGMAIGGAAGLAAGTAAAWMEAPKGSDNPWGDFFRTADNLPVLRPPRLIKP